MENKNLIILALVAVVLVLVGVILVMSLNNGTVENNTTNDTVNITLNDTENQTNNTTTQTKTTKKQSTKKSSDDIPSEGTYKGVDYSLHQGGYPYYSPQNDKVYYSKQEEYNDLKDAVDSGIAN